MAVNQYYEMIKNNPEIFQGAGQLSSLLQGDTSIYGKERTFENAGQIGSTGVGRGLSGLGDAGIASGNPYAMAGGVLAKGIGGAVDVAKYLGSESPDISESYKGDDFTYNLGDEVVDTKNIDPSKVGWQAAGKTALLGGVPAIFAGIFAKKKAKKLKKEMQAKIREGQEEFNTANFDRATRQSVRESFKPTTRPGLFSSGYSDIFGQF